VGRAFGSIGMYYSGDEDKSMERKIEDVCKRWGGDFKVIYTRSPFSLIKNWKRGGGVVVHLTMYGIPINKIIDDIRRVDRVLVVVGSEKVDSRIFGLADYNISITSQPHSEVAALAVFLDYYYKGKELDFTFENAKYRVVPSDRGKKIIKMG
jgi:tRNA (cytidine56-2'-O)-methyltransferase